MRGGARGRGSLGSKIGAKFVIEHVLGDFVKKGMPDVFDVNSALRVPLGFKRQCREHVVHSGLCLWRRPDDAVQEGVETTRLVMDPISDADLAAYLATDAWEGKAGAFGYQDGLDWVHVARGSESNVVGLPLELLKRLLEQLQP